MEKISQFWRWITNKKFLLCKDLIEGIFKLLLSHETMPVNIGNPHEITIEDFAKEVIRLTNSKSKIIHQDLPIDDPKVRQPDITRAKEVLGWEPKVSRKKDLELL